MPSIDKHLQIGVYIVYILHCTRSQELWLKIF